MNSAVIRDEHIVRIVLLLQQNSTNRLRRTYTVVNRMLHVHESIMVYCGRGVTPEPARVSRYILALSTCIDLVITQASSDIQQSTSAEPIDCEQTVLEHDEPCQRSAFNGLDARCRAARVAHETSHQQV